jgi:hypothetical protein
MERPVRETQQRANRAQLVELALTPSSLFTRDPPSYHTYPREHTALSGLAATHVESIRVRRHGATTEVNPPGTPGPNGGGCRGHDGKRACPRAEGMQPGLRPKVGASTVVQ